ncbi:MAG TPA: response regulator [Cytophagaceae bacterium]|jgi:CheY-like chemotaxis protein|nr:response regulator [Cytophagaceae bacterium]
MTLRKYKNIFVVDDDDVNNFVTLKFLHQFSKEYEVETYSDPVQAFEELEKAKRMDRDFPDVILLDINMPKMSGFEFLQKMNVFGISDKIEVIMYSSSIYQEDKRKANHFSNVIGYMEKPFSIETYESILESNSK